MSMNYYSVDDYGLLITTEMLKIMASKMCEDYTEEMYEEDEWSFNEELYDEGLVERISEFIGEAIAINDDGTSRWYDCKSYNCDTIHYLPVEKINTLFKAAYNNIDEIIDEFKKKLGEYLPEDFDYRNNIRHISGCYYG